MRPAVVVNHGILNLCGQSADGKTGHVIGTKKSYIFFRLEYENFSFSWRGFDKKKKKAFV